MNNTLWQYYVDMATDITDNSVPDVRDEVLDHAEQLSASTMP